MELELNGRVISKQPNNQIIERTILKMKDEGSILTLSDGRQAFIQAAGSRKNGFIMTGQDSSGQRQYDQLTPVGTAEVVLAFSAFLTGSSLWKETVPKRKTSSKPKPGQMSGKSIIVVISVIIIIVLGMVGFGMFMTAHSGGQVASSGITQFLPIVVGIALYFGWLLFLFSWFRPRLAGWLSNILNINVSENLISGSWHSSGPIWKKLLIFSIEMAVFIPGALVPLAAVGLLLIR